MFKQDETASREKIIDQEDQSGTSLLPTENLERQKIEGNLIVLPIFDFLPVFR